MFQTLGEKCCPTRSLKPIEVNKQEAEGVCGLPGGSTRRDCIHADSSWGKPWTLPAPHTDLHLRTQETRQLEAQHQQPEVHVHPQDSFSFLSSGRRRRTRFLLRRAVAPPVNPLHLDASQHSLQSPLTFPQALDGGGDHPWKKHKPKRSPANSDHNQSHNLQKLHHADREQVNGDQQLYDLILYSKQLISSTQKHSTREVHGGTEEETRCTKAIVQIFKANICSKHW